MHPSASFIVLSCLGVDSDVREMISHVLDLHVSMVNFAPVSTKKLTGMPCTNPVTYRPSVSATTESVVSGLLGSGS